jgi:outer membrane immunogenic protein
MKYANLSRSGFVVSALLIAAPLSAAHAADMAVKAPPVAAPVAYTWTGCYVGGFAGGLWAHKDWTDVTPGGPTGPLGGHDVDGGLFGGQVGCDYQPSGNLVFGIQGSFGGLDAKGSNVNQLFPAVLDQTKISALSTVTARAGYAMGNLLGYVKGGGAWVRDSYTLSVAGAPFSTASETRGGYTLGVGAEYAFSRCVSGFAEYDYYGFGTRNVTFPSAATDIYGIRERASAALVGVNVRFGHGGCSGAPPAPTTFVTK